MGDVNQVFPQVAFTNTSKAQTYTMNDLNALADYSASRYAKTPEQYQHYYEYYTNYFSQQIAQGAAISLSSDDNQANSVNAAAAVAHQAMLQRQRKIHDPKGSTAATAATMTAAYSNLPTGTDGRKYRKYNY